MDRCLGYPPGSPPPLPALRVGRRRPRHADREGALRGDVA